ncbi:Magnesium and cobalt efflux protein CorC [Sulfurospirillum diekertiae]|uniref:Magnesium and cobalt efflux protein CorC n=1 Tax=Sulfurospirillum diekertiae TaxID=1854492 RepID=A0A1Y0HLT9_9BACT|nr:hemolysin family protein [Sulfurospirillum diekertiae]ARU49087.1 Magnesium and cobalt efflux protein CorC [Sulfurospirillum diekertiae]
MTLLIVYLSLAICVSFLCSMMEAILLSSTNSYIESLPKEVNEDNVAMLKGLKSNIDKPISSILTINTFANTMGAAGVGAQAQILFGQEWQTAVAFGITLLILYFSEIIPKTIGAIYWKKLLIPAGHIITFFVTITIPFTWLSSHLTNYISKNKKHHSNFSRDEIMAVVAMGEKEGSILSKESDLIENLLKLKNIKAKDIMTPRSVVFALPATTTIEDAIEDDRMYIHSRIPVFGETLDDVVGIAFNQRILEESVEDHDKTTLADIAHEVHMVSEYLPVPNLIDQFIKRKTHLFVVFDSYGQTAGVVTLEDAIETLLGVEIVDEMDEVEDMQLFAKDRSKKISRSYESRT